MTGINWSAFVSQVARARLDEGLGKLDPFMKHRIDCESPEQVALTIAGIAYLLAGQEEDTAEMVCAAALQMHAGFEQWQASREKAPGSS